MDIKYGTLIRWIAERNFGFIREDSGLNVFVHVSGFTEKIAPPQNTRVRFCLVANPQKPGHMKAADVEVIAARTIAGQRSSTAAQS